MYEVGDVIPLTLTVRNSAGALDDGGAVTIVVTAPDGTVSSPTILHPSLGQYSTFFTAALDGLHTYAWTVTGLNAGVQRDVFVIEDNPSFVSTTAALKHMRAQQTITSADDIELLRTYVHVACDAVELDLGRSIAPEQLTETVSGIGQTAIILSRSPILSVTAVSESGTVLTTGTDYVADLGAGILYRGTTSAPRAFKTGQLNLIVSYKAGYAVPPSVARKVALNGVQRMWQGSQQNPHPSIDDVSADQSLHAGVLTPLELAAYLKLKAPGLA